MSFRTTGLLLLCVIVAGGLFWWSRSVGGPAGLEVESDPLVPGKPMAVEVSFASRQYTIRRDGDGWAQTDPQYAPLQREAGQAWEQAIAALRPTEEVQPGVGDTPGLATLALAPPAAEVTVITDNGAVPVALGDQTLAGTGYVRMDDGRVLLVPDDLHNLVYGPPPVSNLAQALPLPPLAALDRVTFTRGRESLTMHRLSGGWSLRPDALRRVRPEVLDALTKLTEDTPVVRHRDNAGELARYGLQPPRATLRFSGPDRPDFTLEVGRAAAVEEGAVFARLSRSDTPGPVIAIPLERARIAFAPLGQFRDPRVFEAEADDVTGLRVVMFEPADAGEIVLRETGAGLGFADASPAIDATPEQFLAAVLALRSKGAVPESFGVGFVPKPTFTIHLAWGVTRAVVVRVYRTPAGWFAHRDDEAEATDLSEASITRLLALLPGNPVSP